MLMMSQNRLAARDRLEAHNDDEINRKAEEDVKDRRTKVLRHVRRGFAGLKSCATYEALRGHPESPPGTVLFFRLQSGAIPTRVLAASCVEKQLLLETAGQCQHAVRMPCECRANAVRMPLTTRPQRPHWL